LSIRNSPPAKPRRKYQKGEVPEKTSTSIKSVASSLCGSLSSISNSKSSINGDN
jgi:hypothetical protein